MMRILAYATVLLSIVFLRGEDFSATFKSKGACTYGFSGGRLGDNLIAYLHAKWFACQHQIPLLYRPFPYSDRLNLHTMEVPYTRLIRKPGNPKVMQRGEEAEPPRPGEVLEIPYFPDFGWEHVRCTPHLPRFEVDWEQPAFREMMRTLVSPRAALNLPYLPTDHLCIAVHWRKGTGVDATSEADRVPLKLPPDSFYLESVKAVLEQVRERPCYLFLFTDHSKPSELMKKLQQVVPHQIRGRISWEHRSPSECRECVLEDLFHMARFDVLIRPCSNFSYLAAKLGNPILEVAPLEASRDQGVWHITQIDWRFRPGTSYDALR